MWQTVTASMKEAFWDHYYTGYTKVGTYSNSQNCYGYAFGTGTFVADGTYGAETILSDDWEDADEEEVEVAYKSGGHAIKVTPKMCEDEQAGWYIIQKSSEKFHSSAVYEKTGDCPDGVGLKGEPYDYYKKKAP